MDINMIRLALGIVGVFLSTIGILKIAQGEKYYSHGKEGYKFVTIGVILIFFGGLAIGIGLALGVPTAQWFLHQPFIG
jgi:hypothetical protein